MRWALLLCLPLTLSAIDLTHAVIVAPAGLSRPEEKAVQMLIEEVEKRTQIRWTRASTASSGPVEIRIGVRREDKPESYTLTADTQRVTVAGADPRGTLFGVGRLLRLMKMSRGSITLDEPLALTAAPQTLLRGHQLGYRPKTNSYDGWTLAMWEQYIRDLVVFGTNAIELIPPRSDDAADSPHFPLPQRAMMTGMSQLVADYGLDCWIWYPALDKDYGDPAAVEAALKEWGTIFQALPKVDAVLVPGGDPGNTPPHLLMNLLEKQTANLRRYHAKATMWVAPQSFSREWADDFYKLLKAEPPWLAGVVYGPEMRVSLARFRELVPTRYPIRLYPDITHTRHAQYPVPDWDAAFALTEGREPVNPRPLDMASLYRLMRPYTIGFIAYSEGCNDDVNKIVWSALGWDAEADLTQILREYSRYFVGPAVEEGFAQGLLALERNWRGPALANSAIDGTLRQFQSMENAASPQLLLNWRFQQGLYRAYYDAYTRRRLLHETELEDRARERLRQAADTGALTAIGEAEVLLNRAVLNRPAPDWHARILALGEALYQSIRMQLNVERYQAIAVPRGANLNTLDFPLNSRFWLQRQFAEIRALPNETERLRRVQALVDWDNPGPGGFYDDLGNPSRQPHLVRGPGFATDPAFLESSLVGFANHPSGGDSPQQGKNISVPAGLGVVPEGPYSWYTVAESLYDAPLTMQYAGLDGRAAYRIRVVYAGDRADSRIRLQAGSTEVHPYLATKHQVLEYDIPRGAVHDGRLTLQWNQPPGLRGAGRGCQVAEVWLVRKP